MLSAARCFFYKGENGTLSTFLIEVLLGKFNLNVKNETGSETALIRDIIIHPALNINAEKFDYDIAIVVLDKIVTFTDHIQPICLPHHSDSNFIGKGTVVEWGESEKSGDKIYDSTPTKLDVSTIADHICLKFIERRHLANMTHLKVLKIEKSWNFFSSS